MKEATGEGTDDESEYAWVARTFGLPAKKGTDVTGKVRGLAVRVLARSVISNSYSEPSPPDKTLVYVTMPHAADLGLRVVPVAEGHARDFDVPHAVAREMFGWGCDPAEREVARSIFDHEACAAMVSLGELGVLRLCDYELECEVVHSRGSDAVDVLLRCVSFAQLFEARLALAPAPAAIGAAASDALLEAARSLGLSARAHPFALTGVAGGDSVNLRYRAHEPRSLRVTAAPLFETGYRAWVSFGVPLGVVFRLHMVDTLDRLFRLFGAGRLRTGDAPFDRAWCVRAGDGEAVGPLLGAEARACLEELRSLGLSVYVHREGATASCRAPLGPEAASRALRLLAALRSTLPGVYESGPYR